MITDHWGTWKRTGWVMLVCWLGSLCAVAQTGSKLFPEESRAGRVFSTLLLGRTYETADKRWWAHVGGATSFVADYNFVDGFWVGASASGGVRLNRNLGLTLAPQLYYLTARNAVAGNVTLTVDYLPEWQGCLELEGGIRSADYNGENGETRRINVIASALFGESVIHYYEKKYLRAVNRMELTDGLMLRLGLTWEQRNMLENHSGSWFGRQVEPNVPGNADFRPMPPHEVLNGMAELVYTPGRLLPSVGLRYDKGLPWKRGGVQSEFDRLELSLQQSLPLGTEDRLDWLVAGGGFLSRKNLQFPDFKHFATTRFPMTETSFDIGFSRVANYMYATDGRWVHGHVSWYRPHLLLKWLPFLYDTPLDEGLHLRSIGIGGKEAYWETGYSIGLKKLIRLGVFAGFEGKKYRSAGVAVSLPLSYMAELSKLL